MASVGDFSSYPQSYEVTEVTEVTQDFFREFPLMSRKLRGYESYDAFWKFSDCFFQKLRGYRSYEGFVGLLMEIFPLVSKVTRLRKLRCFLEIFKLFLPKVTRLQKLRRLRRASDGDFPSCLQSYEVTKVTMLYRNVQFFFFQKLQGFRSYEGFVGLLLDISLLSPKLQGYEVTTETFVNSIHVSCHI